MKLNAVELALIGDFAAFRTALADAGPRVTALRSGLLPGWHRGVAVRE